MMDIVERLAQQAAETINGGEFYDGKWYTEGQRQAWRKAMIPAAKEIKRLQSALQECHDFIENYADVVDGDDGFPEPNQAMALLGLINEALEAQ
jgi:hypothetical protein